MCIRDSFWPDGNVPGDHVDGAFVVDSFYYFKTKGGSKTEYLPTLLKEIREETGFVFVAVCSGGAAVYNRGGGGAYFKQLLELVPSSARFLVSVVCGNDVYNSRFNETMGSAVEDYCVQERGRSLMHFAIAGISADTWRYANRWG